MQYTTLAARRGDSQFHAIGTHATAAEGTCFAESMFAKSDYTSVKVVDAKSRVITDSHNGKEALWRRG